MAIDPSIPLQAGTGIGAPFNQQASLAQFAQTQNGLLQMQQSQQQLAGRNALAQAYKITPIDPTTGLPDQGRLINNLQSIPGGTFAMPDAIAAAQGQQSRQYGINAQALGQTQTRSNVVSSMFAPLLAKGQNVTAQDVYQTLGGAAAAGFPIDNVAKDMSVTFPVWDQTKPMTPERQAAYGGAIHDWIQNRVGRTLSPAEQQATFTPHVGMVDTGGQIQPSDMNPVTSPGGPSPMGAPIGRTLSPGEQVSPTNAGIDPATGAPLSQSTAAYATRNGLGALVPGQGGQSPLGTGRIPAALRNPAYQPPGQPAGAAPSPATGATTGPAVPISAADAPPMQTALGPAQKLSIEAPAQQSVAQANALSDSVQDSPQRQSQISAMMGDLQQFGSGPMSPFFGNIKGRLTQLGLAPNSWADNQAAQENFGKMANQLVAKQAAQMGGVTNEKLGLAAESGPNPLFTNLGNQGVLHILQGNEDALNAKNQAWTAAQQAGTPVTDFTKWSNTFNKDFDPKVFWFNQMSPTERQTLISGMNQTQRKQFQQSIISADRKGWVNLNSMAAQPSQPAAPLAAPPTMPGAMPTAPAPAA